MSSVGNKVIGTNSPQVSQFRTLTHTFNDKPLTSIESVGVGIGNNTGHKLEQNRADIGQLIDFYTEAKKQNRPVNFRNTSALLITSNVLVELMQQDISQYDSKTQIKLSKVTQIYEDISHIIHNDIKKNKIVKNV